MEDVTGLPLGKYLVKEEKKSPIGYMIDKTEYEVNLTYKDQHTKVITGQTTSKEKVKSMQVHIYKSGIKREFRSCSRTTRCRIYNEIIFGCRKSTRFRI